MSPSTPAYLSDDWFHVAGIRFALRGDLQASRQRFRGRPWYVVHDPVTAKNHRLAPAAWYLLSRLDGRHTLDQVWQRCVAELGDQAPGQAEVVELLGRLHAADLVRSDQAGDVAQLVQRRQRQHKPLWLRNLASPLSLRLPLWNCDAFLARWAPRLRPLLGGWGLLLWLLWVAPAGWLAWQHGAELGDNLHDRLLAPANLLLLVLLFPLVKLVHELAHGLVAKAHGVAVHEMGLMFLVLAPVPYVDASGAHALRSRWARAGVGAAGMAAELALAAAAMYVWLLVEPGALRAVMHSVMLIAGISTVVFNANPLLRFDGYYMLSDLVEIPNLASRANGWWLHGLRRLLLGDRRSEASHATPGERAWFIAYAPASLVYRLGVSLAIALFIATEYFFVGVALALVTLGTAVLWPVLKGLLFVLTHVSLAHGRRRALAGLALGLCGLALLLGGWPAPARVQAEGVLWVPPCAEVRAAEAGMVQALLVRPGTAVRAGQPLLRIHSPELQTELLAEQARVRQLQVQWQAELQQDRVQAAITGDALAQAQQALERAEQRVQSLTVQACLDGEFQLDRADDLVEAPVARGDLLGLVRSPGQDRVRVVIEQDDIQLVRQRTQGLQVMLADRAGERLSARVAQEVPGGEAQLPSAALAVAGGGPHATDPSDAEHRRTLRRVFQLELALERPLADARLGTRAHVKFLLQPEPLAVQAWRRLRQLLLSRLDV